MGLLEILQSLAQGNPPAQAPGGAGSALITEPPGTPGIGAATPAPARPQGGGLDFMTRFMMGRAMVGGRAAGDPTGKWKDEGALQFLQTAMPLIQKQQQEQARNQAFAQGVRGFQEALGSGDLDRAEMMVSGMAEMGVSDTMTKSLYGHVNRERERLRGAAIADAFADYPLIGQAVKLGAITVDQALTRVQAEREADRKEAADKRREAAEAIKEQLAIAKANEPKDITASPGQQILRVPKEGTPEVMHTVPFPADKPEKALAPHDALTANDTRELAGAKVKLGGRKLASELTDAELQAWDRYKLQLKEEGRPERRPSAAQERETGPIPLGEIELWRNRKTREKVDPAYGSLQELRKDKDYTRITAKQAQTVGQVETIYEGLKKLADIADRNPAAMALSKVPLGGVLSKDAAEVQSTLVSVATTTRAFGEVGNLSASEQARAVQALTGLSADSAGYRKRLETVLDLLNKPFVKMGFEPLTLPPSSREPTKAPNGVVLPPRKR